MYILSPSLNWNSGLHNTKARADERTQKIIYVNRALNVFLSLCKFVMCNVSARGLQCLIRITKKMFWISAWWWKHSALLCFYFPCSKHLSSRPLFLYIFIYIYLFISSMDNATTFCLSSINTLETHLWLCSRLKLLFTRCTHVKGVLLFIRNILLDKNIHLNFAIIFWFSVSMNYVCDSFRTAPLTQQGKGN